MPRPQRCRQVCTLPRSDEFIPAGTAAPAATVTLTIDEYEVIRLIDLIGLTQAQCADQIGVSRTTVTGIYDSARRKLAEAITLGKRLLIEGGNIKPCERSGSCCSSCCCRNTCLDQKKGDFNHE